MCPFHEPTRPTLRIFNNFNFNLHYLFNIFEMKYSKMIPTWKRKKLWAEFIKYRKFEFNNNFEQLCYKYIKEL